MLTASERSRRARIAAHSLHAQGKTTTEAARAALFRRFEDEVDPDRVLPEAERLKRTEHAKAAHYERVQAKRLKTLAARRKAKDAEETGG